MTHIEMLKNQRSVEHAVAQQKIEGLVVPPEVIANLHRVARGEMTAAEALRQVYAQFAHVQVRQ